MLTIRYGPCRRTNARLAVEEICRGAKDGLTGQILLVPEQLSFQSEWQLCAQGGDSISLSAEVLSFSRLANRVFAQTGGAAVTGLSKTGRLVAMAGALEQIRSRLKVYGGQITKPEFLLQLLQAADEFRGYGVTGPAIAAARQSLSGALAQKLEELGLIVETYQAMCAGARQDPADTLDRLIAALEESEFALGRHVVVEGFSDFTLQELGVLDCLLRKAASVSVYLPCDSLGGGRQHFSLPRQTAATLRELARRSQVPDRCLPVEPAPKDPALVWLRESLFSPSHAVWEGPAPALRLVETGSAYEECLDAVGSIQALLAKGVRCREISVALTDRAQYAPVLEPLLEAAQIPFHMGGSSQILAQPVIRAVLSALEAAACGMEPEPVADYLKSGFAPVDRQSADLLENYAVVWDLQGAAWERPFTASPFGLKAERRRQEETEPLLQTLNQARETAMGPLLRLRAALRRAEHTGAQVLALEAFLEEIDLAGTLDAKARALFEQGELQRAQEYGQLYEILLDTMEQIYGVLADTERRPEEFFRFFRAALSQSTVSSIPASLDCVRVGQMEDLRGAQTPYLYVLGARDGLLPAWAGREGLFTQTERRDLLRAGLGLGPDDAQGLERELLTAYLVLTAPEQGLSVSSPAGQKSYLFARLEALFPAAVAKPAAPLPVNPAQAGALLARAGARGTGPAGQAAAVLAARAAYVPGQLDRQSVAALYGSKIRLTASKVDRFAACKFAFYLSYGLQARERAQARMDASLFGDFVHKVLENLVRQVMQEGGFRPPTGVSLERVMTLTAQLCEDYLAQALGGLEDRSPRQVYLFRRSFAEVSALARELWEELRQAEFEPAGVEIPFFDRQSIVIRGKDAQCVLTGFVDRADLYRAPDGRVYLRVVDYKTGVKDFDYTDILVGRGLQMLLYLFTLTQRSEAIFHTPVEPAGVQYFPARYRVVTLDEGPDGEEAEKNRRKDLRRKGIALLDEQVLRAMEADLKGYFSGFKADRSGNLKGNLATPAQFDRLRRHVERTVGRMTDEITRGQLEANPFWRQEEDSACKWCEYHSVCHVDSGEIPQRRLKKIEGAEFWAALEQEEQHHG